MFDDERDRIDLVAGPLEKGGVIELRQRLLGQMLMAAELRLDVGKHEATPFR